MRFQNTLLLALPALAVADQIPLGDQVKEYADKVQGWFKQATSYVTAAAPSIPSPMDAGAAVVADHAVTKLTLENWRSVLAPSTSTTSEGPEEWMLYVTGGNTTCHGLCGPADKAWNKAVPVLAARPNGPHLASLDCDTDMILCNSWSAGPPAIWHFLIPQPLPDQSKPATSVRVIVLNRANATASDITTLHTEKKYLAHEPYEGAFHPFDGWLVKLGLSTPVAYVLWAFAKMPSWLPMLFISFISRRFMSRRMGPAPAPAAPAAGAARPAAAR